MPPRLGLLRQVGRGMGNVERCVSFEKSQEVSVEDVRVFVGHVEDILLITLVKLTGVVLRVATPPQNKYQDAHRRSCKRFFRPKNVEESLKHVP